MPVSGSERKRAARNAQLMRLSEAWCQIDERLQQPPASSRQPKGKPAPTQESLDILARIAAQQAERGKTDSPTPIE